MEYGAACDRVLGPDAAPMVLNDAFADSKPQAGASLVRSLCNSPEGYENAFERMWRYAGAVVLHLYDDIRRPWQNADLHASGIRAISAGIPSE